VLFLGVMSDLYVVWDICGCFPARGASLRPRPPRACRGRPHADAGEHAVWGIIWCVQALVMFAIGLLVGLVAFKVRIISIPPPHTRADACGARQQTFAQQRETAKHFLPLPGAANGVASAGAPGWTGLALAAAVAVVQLGAGW
jgi:hypothetical protein